LGSRTPKTKVIKKAPKDIYVNGENAAALAQE